MPTPKQINRRRFLLTGAAAAGGLATGGFAILPSVTFGAAPGAMSRSGADTVGEGRFVFIILRGALDGLSAVPPYGDPDYVALRRELALGAPGSAGGCLKLDNTFGLHPSFGFLHDSFAAGELTVFHAAATPYRERSHFDGQDVLENGLTEPHTSQTGWLNRALASGRPGDGGARRSGPEREAGIALGQNIPLMMRGPAAVASWSPTKLAALDDDTLQRIADRYAGDPVLSHRLADALESDAIATADGGEPRMLAKPGTPGGNNRYGEVVRATAGFLRAPDGPRVAVFDTTGWDTHANEGNAQGQLALRLASLDEALRSLKEELGPAWRSTAVMIATEFGRTAATNGTRGTDHGTASAAFLLGGAVHGGRVVADWPGLSRSALYQGRDLKPTLDLRSIMKGVLSEQLRISDRALEGTVFPESSAARIAHGLIRAV